LGSAGIAGGTSQFAIASIDSWFERVVREGCSQMRELTITVDYGGSDGAIWAWIES
jgi:hypothetical protein